MTLLDKLKDSPTYGKVNLAEVKDFYKLLNYYLKIYKKSTIIGKKSYTLPSGEKQHEKIDPYYENLFIYCIILDIATMSLFPNLGTTINNI